MAGTGYNYNGKLWRPCPTKSDSNNFFHSAFGTRDREGEEYLDKQAHFRRMRWVTLLTYFTSETMPYGLADVLRKCFSSSDKYRHASIDDKESFMMYVSNVIASTQNVTVEEIPILATLENIKIVVISNTKPDTAITIKPSSDILGSYPNVEKAKEEVVLCLEGDTFARLELVKDISTSNEIIVEGKIRKENAAQPKNNVIRYKKGGSAGSKGVQYQISLVAMVLLNSLKNLREWKLSTENEDAGKFDDIVLEETEGATFIQSKHKESGKKRITLNELTSTNSKNDDFSLPKYFLSYLQIKKKFKIKSVIICTNADVHEKALKLLNHREPYSESTLHYDDGDYSFYTLKDEILHDLKVNCDSYYQQNFRNKGVEESAINDENLRDFQKDLQIYFNYPSQSRLEKIVDTLLSHINTCRNSCGNITSEELHSKLMHWFQQKDGVYLTEIRAEATFLEILRDKYCRKLERYKLTFRRNHFDFQRPKQVFRVSCKDSYLLQVLKVYQSVKDDIPKILFISPDDGMEALKRVVEVFELPLYNFLIIICPEAVDESVTTEVCGKLDNILSTYKHKKIILITKDDNKLFQRIGLHNDIVLVSGSVNLEDLHWVSQERLLKMRNIFFQGRHISLEEVLGATTVEKYGTALDTEILYQLIRGQVKVGVPLSELDECIGRYYVSRTFSRILDKSQEENKIFPEGIRHSNKDVEELEKIRSVEIKEEERFTEVNIYDVNEKVVVISDGAGTGKSTVLIKLAEIIKENHPYLWVIRVELNDYSRILKDSLRKGKRTVNIMDLLNSENATKLTNHLEEFLFTASQKVVLLLDGVDEISPDYTGLILGLLKECQEESNVTKIFVTTRPHMIKELEQVSKVKPFTLQPFTAQNQIQFLTNYWENGLQLKDDVSKEKCKRYAQGFLKKWIDLDDNNGNRFTTVPLQLRMMAEVFQETTRSKPTDWEGCKEYIMGSKVQPNISERMNITDLYRLFVEKKQHIFAEKGNPSGNTIASGLITKIFDDCLVYHRSLALEVILGKEKLHIFSCYQRGDKNIETQMLKIGIVQKTKGEIHFIHRTFADYFVAECLFSELQPNPTIEFQKFLIDTIFVYPQYNVTRTFFESLLWKFEKTLSPNIFKEYRSLKQESSMEFYKLQSHLLHLLAEGDCMTIFALILKCIDFKAVRGKEINIMNFYAVHFNEDVQKNIFGNTLNLLQYLTKEAGVNIKDESDETPLHYAAQMGHLEMVKFLIERGADINSENKTGNNPLHFASASGHLDTVQYLFELGIDSQIRDNDGFTALHLATYVGQLETVKFLTEHGSDTNVVSNNGSTLLHLASQNGQLDTAKYLSELGINPHIRNNFGFTALHMATYFGQLESVKFLTENGSDINVVSNFGSTLLHSASGNGHLNIVKYLLELGIDSHIRDSNGLTALHSATYFGQLETVKFLSEHGSDINAVSNKGHTLLHLASQNGHLDIVKYLFELGIDPHTRDNNGATALQTAALFGQLEIVKFLAENCSDINVASNFRSTLLHLASRNGNLQIVKYLLELGIDLHIRNNNGFTALHLAAYFGQLETVKLLREHGADVNVVNNFGHTLLHSASRNGHVDIIKYLFEFGIDCHIKDNDGFTALQTATYFGQLDSVKFLTEHGSDINIVSHDGSTLLHLASENGHLGIIKYLFELGIDYHIRDNNGFTALQRATCFGQLGIIKFLTEHGSDINVISNDGSTLLYSASANGHLEVVKYIIELGIGLHIRNNNGFTAVHGAALFGHLDVVKFLVGRGSNVNDINNYDQSVLHSASVNGRLDVARYLLEIGVDISIRDCHGFTILQSITRCGDLKTIKFLVEYGLDINISNNNGYTLLHLAGANGHLDAIKYFLELGMDPNIRDNHGFTAFHLVDGKDQLEIMKRFIECGLDINIKSTNGFTSLHLTSADGRVEILKFLLENGADFGVRDNDGFTPLHLAAEWGQLDAVKLLVEHGLGYNATTNDGQTPLHLSSEAGHSDVVRYLLELGADCNVRDYSGRTAMHLAVLADHLDVVKLLVKHGGDLKVKDNGGHTALNFAINIGHSDTIDFLMQMETDANIRE